jgi:hypothetical protein
MRGWVVKYKNGEIIPEWDFDEDSFRFLPKQNEIESVALYWTDHRGQNPKHWVFSNKKHYFEFKTASMLFGSVDPSKTFHIVSRSVGYWENGKKVTWTLDEQSGQLSGPKVENA